MNSNIETITLLLNRSVNDCAPIIVPLYKRGEQEKIENYRSISLLCTTYMIYAEIVRMRLEIEVVEKGIISESQAGFRKGKSTLDNMS